LFVLEYTPSILAGLILAALLAAIMSTSDSFLNIGAGAMSRDIPRALGRSITDDTVELRVTQAALATMTVLATIIVLNSNALVGILGAISYGFLAAGFFSIAAFGLNWKGATKEGAIASLVVVIGVNIFYNVPPGIVSVTDTDWATALNDIVSTAYPLPAAVPAESMSLLVVIPVFILVSIATQDGSDLPSDLHGMFEG
jgi:sodium/proline symporter